MAEAELVTLDVIVDDALPVILLVPVLVPLLVADALALDAADIVWLAVPDVLAMVVTDVDAEDDLVLVSEADTLDVAVDVAVDDALPEMLLVPAQTSPACYRTCAPQCLWHSLSVSSPQLWTLPSWSASCNHTQYTHPSAKY